MVSTSTRPCDAAAAVAKFADALLAEAPTSPTVAEHALDQLRRSVHAADARLWFIDENRAELALQAGNRPHTSGAVIDLEDASAVLTRLRRHGVLQFGTGEASGLERLLPLEGESFVIATVASDDVIAALVIGWKQAKPPCDNGVIYHFRIAASMLVNVLQARSPSEDLLHDPVLSSLTDRIAVIQDDGTVIGVNAAWIEFARARGRASGEALTAGANYLEVWRQRAASSPSAAAALGGIEAVCSGAADTFETAYAYEVIGGEQWCTMTARRLHGEQGKTLVVHSDVISAAVTTLARRLTEGLFHGFIDSVPLPVWLIAPDGRVIHGNQQCIDAVVGGDWTDSMHREDRARARAVFAESASRRVRCELELRVKASDGTYRWCAWIGQPLCAPDGRLENYVAVCYDITEKHQAETTMRDVATQLLAAQEAESSRVARELHDDLGQQVALLASELDMLSRRRLSLARMRLGVARALKDLQSIASSIHTLSHHLHPARLKLLGLVRTLESLCRDVSRRSAIHIEFVASNLPVRVDETVALCLFRVTQEALQNALKHSGASRIDVHITGTPAQVTLRIVDNGTGFGQPTPRAVGLGLQSMRERIDLSRGRLSIETAPGRGTAIEVTVPLPGAGGAIG